MSDCLFCKIINGDIPADKVYADDDVLGFNDINPQAPHHVLFIPKKHISTVNELQAGDAELVGKLYLAAKQHAAELGVAEDGYRLVMNTNAGAGQTVFHLHLHMLAGRLFSWPPG
ncbi:MAG: histidine triad nucleotide-binding protein [Thioalkalispiraceae bacterium]|jgi:histidine triad (HIT) family protein